MTASAVAVPSPEVRMVAPLPGFDGEEFFELTPIDEGGVLMSMRSVRTPQLRFVLTAADTFFDDYRPVLGPEVTEALGVDTAAGLQVLLVLSIPTGLLDATANMRAPIVVEPVHGRAVQVVLDDDALSMRRPLLAAVG